MTRFENLVFGISWRTAISDDRSELLAHSKELNANSYVEAAFDVKHKYGLCTLKSLDDARSAAVVFGQIIEGGNGIFIHQLNREEHCFIAVRDTLPVENCDIVGSRGYVIEAAKSYAENARKNEGVAPKFYGDLSKEEVNGAVPFELLRLVEEGESVGEIKRVRSINPKTVFVIVGIILVSAAWFAQDLISMVTTAQPPKIDPKTAHHNAVMVAIDKVVTAKQFPSNVMPGYIQFARSLPVEVAGWKLDTVDCEQTDCVAHWKRSNNSTATNRDFLKALVVAPDDQTVTFPGVDVISRKISFQKNDVPGQLVLGTQLKFGETIMSWLQTLNDKPRTDPMAPLVPAAPNFTPDPSDMPMSGGISFTVPYSDLEKVASLPNAITIQTIKLTYKDRQNIKFEFQGKYYAL